MEKYLIIGLGNIGEEFINTKHNIGFDIIDFFAKKHNLNFIQEKYVYYSSIKLKGKLIILIKPTTYMNLSGNAVLYWKNKEKINQNNILILVDDLAISLQQIRIRDSGGSAGHNGLKSIEECLHTNKYNRLRFGIGNDFKKGEQANFVLSKWNENQKKIVNNKIEKCSEAIEKFAFIPFVNLMNEYNSMSF